jgi:hypothetical protein
MANLIPGKSAIFDTNEQKWWNVFFGVVRNFYYSFSDLQGVMLG